MTLKLSAFLLASVFVLASGFGWDLKQVDLESGILAGETNGGITSFKGIPYAAPPVRSLRWAAPRPASSWTGVRKATEWGAECPQPKSNDFAGKVVGQEDCLTLNVWTPQVDRRARKAVMVFIHGGFYVKGSSASRPLDRHEYDGANIAQSGDVVVVSFNYRLGVLGYLAGLGLSGNYGLLDQLAALRWVQKNIREFGGDPRKVTVFGESAGASSITALLSTPLSSGLFSQAILQSAYLDAFSPEQSLKVARKVARKLGCEGQNAIDCMRQRSYKDVYLAAPLSYVDGIKYVPTVDGEVLPEFPSSAFQAGRGLRIPLLLGSNRDEATTVIESILGAPLKNEEAYRESIARSYGEGSVDALSKLYPVSAFGSAQKAMTAMVSEQLFTCPTRRIARSFTGASEQPVFRYVYTHRTRTPFLIPYGAGHALELPFLFGNFSWIPGFIPPFFERPLGEIVRGYWTRFAKFGDPNKYDRIWPRYAFDSEPVLALGLDPKVARSSDYERGCDYWDQSGF